MSGLLEFLRFLYTGRIGVVDPLTALDVLFLTKGDEGSGGKAYLFLVLVHCCLLLLVQGGFVANINSTCRAQPLLWVKSLL